MPLIFGGSKQICWVFFLVLTFFLESWDLTDEDEEKKVIFGQYYFLSKYLFYEHGFHIYVDDSLFDWGDGR